MAASAGASFGFGLMWALLFSIVACMILQETAARLTLASGKNLGEILARRFATSSGSRIGLLIFFGVAFGCAAYEAGNILGAVSGLQLFEAIPSWSLTLVIGIFCFTVLWIGRLPLITRTLSIVVALMGIVFLLVAFRTPIDGPALLRGAVIPSFPAGSSLFVIGLIGTTIVPYNLFLASGISKGQQLGEMRLGIIVAVLIGGFISLTIMVGGTLVEGGFTFGALTEALRTRVGMWSSVLFGIGLFAAGLSSALTAPLAAAVTGRSLLGESADQWQGQGLYFRLVWMSVLGIGLLFGLLNIQPVPAIILAQAINGILLPLVAVFLFQVANDRSLLEPQYTNTLAINLALLAIVWITTVIGLNNVWKAVQRVLDMQRPATMLAVYLMMGLATLLILWLVWTTKNRNDRLGHSG